MVLVDELAAKMAAVQLMTDDEVKAIPQAYEDGEAGFGALKSERGLFPLRAVKVTAKVSALSSHITLDQTFLNSYDTPLEATYIFPLPSRAAVTSFRLEVKDRVVEGIIKERGEARREYTQAIQEGHRAAIAEEERAGVFTIRVGNIGAGELASVRLTMAAPLPFTDGEATFRFPLLVAPRYIPGVKLGGTDVGNGTAADTDETPDASRITPPTMVTLPGFPDPVQLSIEVEFDSASLPVSNVRSSLHTVMITDVGADGQQSATSPSIAIRRLKLDPTGDRRLNRDFILRFNVTSPSLLTASLVLSDDQGDELQEGTWQLTLIAPQGGGNGGAAAPRDVAFVIDRSGSMGGWKMVAARSATARVVDTLTDSDRFTVLAFDSYIETPPGHSKDGLVPATDYNRQAVVNYLAKLDARGGTEMATPLQRAADALQAPRAQAPGGFWPPRGGAGAGVRDRVLVLVTDGQVGNEDWIMGKLAPKLQGVRVFTLGIDQSVNEGFLTRLAALTPGGACELVESQGRLEYAMDRIHRLISTPALTDVQIDGPSGPGIEPILDAVTPAKHGAVFTGIPTVISGRYRKTSAQGLESARAHFVTVSAKTAAGENWNQAVPAQQTLNPALSALWARALIRELDDRFTIASTPSVSYYPGYGRQVEETPNPDKPDELRARILALSLRFKVLSRFSAFVAVDKDEKIESNASQLTRVTQPVESPAGWGPTLGAAGACGLPPGSMAGGSALRGGRGRSYESGVLLTSAPFGGGEECESDEESESMNESFSLESRRPSRYSGAERARSRSGNESYTCPKPGAAAGLGAYKSGGMVMTQQSARGGSAYHKKVKRLSSGEAAERPGTMHIRMLKMAPPEPYESTEGTRGGAPKPANPAGDRARVAAALATVRLILISMQAEESLVKKLVEELKEVLCHVAEQWQIGSSFEVLRGAVKAFEAGEGVDVAQVEAALERIEQSLESPKVGA